MATAKKSTIRWPAWARKTHKWLALIIGVQALFWMLSGLYMTAVHIDIIHGDALVRPAPVLPIDPASLRDPAEILARYAAASTIKLDSQLGQPVFVVGEGKKRVLVDARSGAQMSPLDQAAAQDRARAHFAGPGKIVRTELLSVIPSEIKGRPAPIWRVEFAGRWRPTLYISPQTGELVAKRHDLWRMFDFVWMFHIMDYEARVDVNNLLLRVAAWMAVATSLTGAWLLLYSFRRKRRVRKPAQG
ncbi:MULTISPECIES: PepSY domain-containing protein [Caulobacter]|jgi:hypothetical protein|uniref:PepSY domain-containing protein n=1 Tax=Caulobacter TaxID=75 RepID=UPI0007852373|nr:MULTISPECIES: PepSY domain-containing protein [Caulobacter]ATC24407.1 hypothetical protein CA608_07695 [Caulobacter vibrioides]PIC00029.1 hypothetical protein CSW60_00160 [Caulobacter sp. X]